VEAVDPEIADRPIEVVPEVAPSVEAIDPEISDRPIEVVPEVAPRADPVDPEITDQSIEVAPALADEAASVPTSAADATSPNVVEQEAQEIAAGRLLRVDEGLPAEELQADKEPRLEEHPIDRQLLLRRLEAMLPSGRERESDSAVEVDVSPEQVPRAETRTSPAKPAAASAPAPEPIAKPVRAPRGPAAASRPGLLRKAALAALILLSLALLAVASILRPLALPSARQTQEQLSRTRAEPAVAIAAETPAVVAAGSEAEAAISEASDLDHWRQRTVDALLETLDEGDSNSDLDAIPWTRCESVHGVKCAQRTRPRADNSDGDLDAIPWTRCESVHGVKCAQRTRPRADGWRS
jgi:hypothetical protein